MPSYVAFLRAVNVGGRFVKMAELRSALSDNGFDAVETHIQSGNVRVTSPMRSSVKVAAEVHRVLTDRIGFDVPAIVRTPAQLRALMATIDGLPSLHGAEARRYVAFASDTVPAEATRTLDAWNETGERAKVFGADVVADLIVEFNKITLTNTRIERITGLTTTWRDVKVVRAVTEKWGR
ncbi:MAG: DUF1697 domain-containing protein [Nostocoides sp.]